MQSDVDKIKNHLYNNVVCTETAVLAKLERLKKCDDLIRLYPQKQKVIGVIARLFGITTAKATSLYNDTIEVFGSSTNDSKQARYRLNNDIERLYDLYDKAMQKQQFALAHQIVVSVMKFNLQISVAPILPDVIAPVLNTDFELVGNMENREDIVDFIERTYQEHGLDPNNLKIYRVLNKKTDESADAH